MNQAPLFGGRGSAGQSRFGRFRGRIVIFHHRLDAVLRVSSGADQVLLGVVDLVLVELLLGVGDIKLVVERIFLVAGGFGVRGGELRHLRLVVCEGFLRFLKPVLYFLFSSAQWRWI